MNPSNSRVLVFAALLAAPVLPAWSQAPSHPRPQQIRKPAPAREPQVIIKETPIEEGDPLQAQAQGQPAQDPNAAAQDPSAAAPAQDPAGAAPQAAAPVGIPPEQIGLSFAAPQGWQQGDPTKFTLPGDICCAWSPDGTASIVVFVQKPGKPLNPRVLLDQSAAALKSAVNAQVQTQEVRNIGGLNGFSLVVSAPGNGAAIDGKGTVPTTQHWAAIPREQDVVIFLMTSPSDKFAANEQVFNTMLGTLKVSGTQTAAQQAAK